MESATHQLSTYPHLIPVAAIPGTVYQATSLHRRHPENRNIFGHDLRLHRRSGSSANLNYQDIIARHVNHNAAVKHSRMVSESITSEDEPDDRKGELRYDFKFGGFEDGRNPSFKPLRAGRDRNSAFTVASARTLCSLSPSPSPPASPSPSFHPPSSPADIPKPSYVTNSHSTLTPMIHKKQHGLYCRIKTFLISFLRLNSNTTVIEICKHKFRHSRCKKCDLPEAILPYLGGLRAGFYCKEYGCEGCIDCTSTLVYDTYGSEEELRVAPLQMRSSMVASSLYTDTPAIDTGSRSTISGEAPQIGPIDFISTAQHTHNTSDHTSERSILSTNLSDSLLKFCPTHYGIPEPFSSPTEYSLSVPPYLPVHQIDTSTPCRTPIVFSNNEDSASSPQSTESNEVLEVDIPATAVPMVQASPTTIRIRHSRTASQPPATPRRMQNLHDIAHGAVHGDVKCQTMILKLYQEISNTNALPASSRHSESDCHLIKKARLVLGLQVQKAAGRMSADLVEKPLAQLFPQDGDEAMHMEEFAACIRRAVDERELSEARAMQILVFADDEGYC